MAQQDGIKEIIEQMNEEVKGDEENKQGSEGSDDSFDYDEIDLKPFDLKQVEEVHEKIRKGEITINHRAAATLMISVEKISKVMKDSIQILTTQKALNEHEVKHFITSSKKLELVDYILEAAFLADPKDIFYQPLDSDDWKLLNSSYKEISVNNAGDY